MTNRKIHNAGDALHRVDHAKVTEGLGAERRGSCVPGPFGFMPPLPPDTRAPSGKVPEDSAAVFATTGPSLGSGGPPTRRGPGRPRLPGRNVEVRLPPDLLRWLEREARREKLCRGELIRRILYAGMELRQKKKPGETP